MIGYTFRINIQKGDTVKARYKIFLGSMTLLFLLTGCGNHIPEHIVKSPSYQAGEQDGCATANGTYTKDSERFKTDTDYENGWFAGRRECNPSFNQE